MEKIQLTLLFKIIGIGSASGLLYQNDKLFLVSDNSSYLYEYHLNNKNLIKIPLDKKPQENIEKKSKPDFESITSHNDTLYIFGSGSTENRNSLVLFNMNEQKITQNINIADLYLAMQNFGKIKPEDFNIEGAIYNGKTTYFFNRGNGITNKNVLFSVDGNYLTEEYRIISNDYKLPKIKGVRTSFTDAILVDSTIYFLATAENTTSTYHDGEVLGSIIGTIDCETMKITSKRKITGKHKFEGLTLFSNNENEISFLLCEDNDTDIQESSIYKLTLKK